MDNPEERIKNALEIANHFGQIGGSHHKMWVIDQMVRALCGCPFNNNSIDKVENWTFIDFGENEEYKNWVKQAKEGEELDEYGWDIGIAP